MKKQIVVKIRNPKMKGPSAYQTFYFDPDNHTIETAKQSLTQWGYLIEDAYLDT